MICHLNELKDRNHMVFLIDAIKVFDEIHNYPIIKSPRLGMEETHYIEQIYSQQHAKWAKSEAFQLRSGTRQECLLSQL